MTWHPLYRWLGKLQGWSGQVWKTLLPLVSDPRPVQLIMSHYTNFAILAYSKLISRKIYNTIGGKDL